MKIVNILLIGIMFLLPLFSKAQEQQEGWFRCGTDSVYDEMVRHNPQVALNRAKLKDFVREYIRQNPKSDDDEVYVIPVVFHVLHEYGTENISLEAIQAAIDQMNKDYRKMRSDTSSIVDEFKPIAADTKIEFRLARKDPNGNCTMGVHRVYSSATNHGDESAKTIAGSWDNSKYLNVWTVKSMSSSGVAGYSYYPGTAPDDWDGIILLYNYINMALTHEAGHYLNLPHPWGSTNDPGMAENCDIDDEIEDTPNTIGHTSCILDAVTCGSLDNVQNFMDYSYCYRMFTNGQAAVMRATLNSDVSYRNNLWTAENRIATGTDDYYVDEECPPIADFNQNKAMICTGATVTYNDYTYNASSIDSRLWRFEGGSPATSEEENPEVTYNASGKFGTELHVENSVGDNSLIKENTLRVYDKMDGYELPYTEHFETSTFPLITGNVANDFYVENYNPNPSSNDDDNWWNHGTESWMQSSDGVSGKALRIRNSKTANSKNKIYLPNIILDNDSTDLEISFKIAAAKKVSDGYTDELYFYSSTTCGETIRLVHSLSGSRMITATRERPSSYIPSYDEWKTHSFRVPASSLHGNNFRLVIESLSTFGNTIYIDDLSYSQKSSDIQDVKKINLSVYPNPFNEKLFVDIADFAGDCYIEVYDIMGKMLYSGNHAESQINIGPSFENATDGVYFLKVYSAGACETVKVVKEK